MSKKEYISALEKKLQQAGVAKSERQEILSEIEDRFVAAHDQGETVSQVMAKLGTPTELADSYLTDLGLKADEVPQKQRSTLKKIVIAGLLLFINLIFVVWVFVAVYGMILSLIAGGGSVMLAGLLLAAAPALTSLIPMILPAVPSLLIVMAGLTVAFFALAGTLFLVQVLIWVIKLTGKYLQFNIKLVRGN